MEYEHPLSARYASEEMVNLFTEFTRSVMWRKMWTTLAQAQHDCGLPVTKEQVEELRRNIDSVDIDVAHEYEAQFHHDVLAHIAAFGDRCPTAKPIIHLGATSCDITDNGDLLLYKQATTLVHTRLIETITVLREFAKKYASLPVIGYTHFQPAQPTTIGLRACLWLQDLEMDLENIATLLKNWKLRGLRGATGTQASFVALFNGDKQKAEALEQSFLQHLDNPNTFAVTGQTYPRKFDAELTKALAGLGESLHKLGTDLRLLQHTGELQEPFGKSQKGSSAMPYKRNPMLSERLCSLSRLLMDSSVVPTQTAANQWLERSLDDSASRRIIMAQAFMSADSVLLLSKKILSGLQVNETVIAKKLKEELPFFATENILMHCVKKGGDRQLLHTHLRNHAIAAAERIKLGESNDLLERIIGDKEFQLSEHELSELLNLEHFTGRANELVISFLNRGDLHGKKDAKENSRHQEPARSR